MDFEGIVIEESLQDSGVLSAVKIVSTEIEPVTESHKTPWVKQWTMYTISIPDAEAEKIATALSHSLDRKHHWYADFKNTETHFIVFTNKVFRVDRSKKEQYDAAAAFGIAQGIPAYQLDFSPYIVQWKR